MSMIQSDLLLGQEGGAGYVVERSLRFNSSDSAFLSRTPASAGNRKTWTWAGWVKRSGLTSTRNFLLGCGPNSNDFFAVEFTNSSDALIIQHYAGGTQYLAVTTQVFRDASAWFHLVLAVDTTQAINSDRVKVYINGVQVTAFSTYSTWPQNLDTNYNRATTTLIGNLSTDFGGYFNGYLADIHFIDGQALTPSSFTEVSATTGQLIPKAYTGTFTGNSFWLKFADNSAATATTLGKDSSGLGNNWTPNNLSVSSENGAYLSGLTASYTNCSQSGSISNMFDGSTSTIASVSGSNTHSVTYTLASGKSYSSSVRIYAAGATAAAGQRYVLLNGNRTNHNATGWVTVSTGSGTINSFGTGADNTNDSGIYAIEVDGVVLVSFGLDKNNDSTVDTPTSYGTDTGAGGEVRGNYCTFNPLANGGNTLSNGNLDAAGGTDKTSLSTVGMSSGKWYCEVTINAVGTSSHVGIAKNDIALSNWLGNSPVGWSYSNNGQKYNNNSGSAYGNSYTTGDVIGIAFDADAGSLFFYKNGTVQNSGTAAFTGLTSGPYFFAFGANGPSVTFNFGQRQWAYAAPAGFKALCDTNLPAPVVAKPSEVMDVALYTGNGSTQTISGLGFSPDLVWGKGRSYAGSNALYDSVRGATKYLSSNGTGAEGTVQGVTAFNSDGFTLGNDSETNFNAGSLVAWCWDAGTSTVTNTQGSITSTVRANPLSGFSIVTLTTSSSAGTYTAGHGLGIAPAMFITKRRSGTSSWWTYHSALGHTQYLNLSSTSAAASDYGWGAAPTSSVFTFTSDFLSASSDYVVYCFAPVAGYSSAFSFSGNGSSSDGPMVWLGFKPKLLLIKRSDSTGNWLLVDSVRGAYNLNGTYLYANTSDAEATQSGLGWDFLSNGFKIRNSYNDSNASSATYVGFAWAEHPFAYARAR